MKGHQWASGSRIVPDSNGSLTRALHEDFFKCTRCGTKVAMSILLPGDRRMEKIPTCEDVQNLRTVKNIMES